MITKYGAPPSEVSEEAQQEPVSAWTNVDPHAETERLTRKSSKSETEPAEATP